MATAEAVRVLNEGGVLSHDIESALDISTKLQKNMLRLKGKFMSSDGASVDYVKLKASPEFEEYLSLAQHLQNMKLDMLSELQRKVFFIMRFADRHLRWVLESIESLRVHYVYNALTIHGLVAQGKLPDSVLKVQHFFKTTAYNLAGFIFTLDDIEHGILRGNKSHPASIKPQFSADDPRLPLALKSCDSRVHFALVCGAKGCPAINVYTEANVDAALDAAARTYIQSEAEMRTVDNQIILSRLFQWYRQDFGESDIDVIQWIMQYLTQDQKDRASILLMKLEKYGQVTIVFKEYDWSLNSS